MAASVARGTKLASGATVTSGDEIEVTLSVSADRDYEWLMMDDPLPSGFEPIREYYGHYGWHWNYWYSRKEFRDQKVSIAMTTHWAPKSREASVMTAGFWTAAVLSEILSAPARRVALTSS